MVFFILVIFIHRLREVDICCMFRCRTSHVNTRLTTNQSHHKQTSSSATSNIPVTSASTTVFNTASITASNSPSTTSMEKSKNRSRQKLFSQMGSIPEEPSLKRSTSNKLF